MNRHHDPTSSLSPEGMQLFLAGLSGLPEEEVRKAKSLYIRNAISEYKAMEASLQAFGCVQALFAVIPLFWPFIYAQRKMVAAQRTLFRERIHNALDVWRDDLRGESFDLPHDF
ncbi:hypothetical protein [Aeoliella sp.]|uniref:hypothetical protein n=1 Tax=Aeoliella sp. TaxID=2795800 RepID=UPI003CCB97BD